MKNIFSPPSIEDFTRLLKAWRFWILAAFVGALISTALYYIAPPPYRARATVNVDFNLEEAFPQDTDRQHFYYLERESRKLEEIAWSDEVIQIVAKNHNISVEELRSGKLTLSQPAEAGWHFYADDANNQKAIELASVWAMAFTESASAQIGAQDGLNSFIKLDVTQVENLTAKRNVSLSTYLITGVLISMMFSAFLVLFYAKQPELKKTANIKTKKATKKK